MTLTNSHTLKEIHERLRNVSWNPLRVYAQNEQKLAKLTCYFWGKLQGRSRTTKKSCGLVKLTI